jgi:RimJ/RimL family protein N-acetyltransferase
VSLICVYGADAVVGQWMMTQSGETIVPPYVGVGVVDRQGVIHGAIVYTDYNGHTIELSVHFDGTVRARNVVREMFRYPFQVANVHALAARTRRNNARVRSILTRLGFREAGMRRRFYGPEREDDAILYDMLRAECKWIGGEYEKH